MFQELPPPVIKDKSVEKLRGFGPIYCINLDGQPERWEYMQSQFKEWELTDVTRISAYDGRDDDLSDVLAGRYPEMMTSGEIGCVTSHLKAIKTWLETSDSEYAIMMEDDCDMSIVRSWRFNWKHVMSKLPYDWDIFQMAIISTTTIHARLHERFVNDFSTACYAIRRSHAEKLMRFHERRNGKWKLDSGVKPRPVADDLLYNPGKSYAMPLMLYHIPLGSSIHPEHVDVFHRSSYMGVKNFWDQQAPQLDSNTLNGLFDYDPYLGRVAPSSDVEPTPVGKEAETEEVELDK